MPVIGGRAAPRWVALQCLRAGVTLSKLPLSRNLLVCLNDDAHFCLFVPFYLRPELRTGSV